MSTHVFRRAAAALGFIAFMSALSLPVDAGALSSADCDCTQSLGRCAAGGEVISSRVIQPGDPGSTHGRDSQLHWTVRMYWTALPQDRAQCALVQIGIKGEHKGANSDGYSGLNTSIYRRVIPRGQEALVKDWQTLTYSSREFAYEGLHSACQICAVRGAKDLSTEADDLAKSLGLDTTPTESKPLADQLDDLQAGIARWEEQERLRLEREERERLARLEAERLRALELARLEEERRAAEAERQAREYAARQRAEAAAAPRDSGGGGWLGAIGAIAGGMALGYLAAKEGVALPSTAMVPPVSSPNRSSSCPQAVENNLVSLLQQCQNQVAISGGGCETARTAAACVQRVERAAGSCPEYASQARSARAQFEEYARGICAP